MKRQNIRDSPIGLSDGTVPRLAVGVVGVFLVSPPQYPFIPCLCSLANINCPDAAFGFYSCPNSLSVFCRCLATVPRLLFVMGAVENSSVLPPAFCDNCEALGESPVLETLKGVFWSRKRLPGGWCDEMG
jgi:hypothetical protein